MLEKEQMAIFGLFALLSGSTVITPTILDNEI